MDSWTRFIKLYYIFMKYKIFEFMKKYMSRVSLPVQFSTPITYHYYYFIFFGFSLLKMCKVRTSTYLLSFGNLPRLEVLI